MSRHSCESRSDFKEAGCVSLPPIVSFPVSSSAAPVVSEPVIHHRTPTLTKCPNCEAEVVSNVTYRNGLCVWLSCAGCAAIGGILGCCLIPFYVKSFKDVDHSCPNCCYRLGVCKALRPTEHASAKLTCGEAPSKWADCDGCGGEGKVRGKDLAICVAGWSLCSQPPQHSTLCCASSYFSEVLSLPSCHAMPRGVGSTQCV
ncbi:hypothetical protein TcWFU_002318 [Taenia crassiceps]|uniref:LITAF domain-containing protein n=1 Tax=Taenia crassiceps TaxID=6207 RepID=A0ABR4QKM5_9CEST